MTTWKQWILGCDPQGNDPAPDDQWPLRASADLLLSNLQVPWLEQPFESTEEDREAAWEFYVQLRSRIVTRPLPYLDGDEKAALDSVFKLFQFTRDLCKEKGAECRRFSDIAWTFLNKSVRHFTAKWHKRFVDEKLRQDDRHEFREELDSVRRSADYLERLFLALSQNAQISSRQITEAAAPAVEQQDLEFKEILFSASVDQELKKEILDAERSELRARRGLNGNAPVNNVTGLALSGGGLRSATFALGALQGLARKIPNSTSMLDDFDYLSTVSGGGYAGSFLSSFLNSESDPQADAIGLTSDQLPFKREPARESAPMRHLRSASKSLLAGGFWRKWEIPVLALLGWLASVAVIAPPIVLVTLLYSVTNQKTLRDVFHLGTVDLSSGPYHWIVRDSAIAAFVGIFAVGVTQHFKRKYSSESSLPEHLIAIVACILMFLLVALSWFLFPIGAWVITTISDANSYTFPAVNESLIAGVSGAAIPLLTGFASKSHKKSPFKTLLLFFATTVLPAIFLLAVATIFAKYFLFVGVEDALSSEHAWGWFAGSLITSLFCLLFLNINAVSLHPFYRDRLARAYHLTLAEGAMKSSSRHKLSELRTNNKRGPYHLINAALNAPAGTNEALRGRIADFFLFSSRYCGCESTGYQTTDQFEDADPSLDLSTAIAISGAAASPFTGTVQQRFSFWATLLNIRLDYWLAVPGRFRFHCPGSFYWLSQYIGHLTERSRYINLSDGGHIENMGLYELLRRKCRYIVVVDGECDPGISCGSFLQVRRYAAIDFGINIEIDLSRLKVGDARATEDDGEPAEPLPTGEAASPLVDFHFALGRIHYGGGEQGLLLYLKSSMSGNEDKTLTSYREREPEFPHQSTADLAYDEEQFEAYRSLGQHIVDDALREGLVGTPENIAEWFHALEEKLLR